MSWRTKWRIYEYIRNSIWIVPAILGALAVVMGIILPDIDERTGDAIGVSFGASAAQGILGALAGGMITFTGFVFSILLLAVQFGSSQFSPRMLRRFLRDPTTKISLGIFMATFIYALLVLRKIEPADNADFIPDLSVSVSLIMLLLSMVMFLRLISKTTQGLRVAVVVGDLGRDGAAVMQRVYPEPVEGPEAGGIEEVDGGEGAAEPSRVVTYGQEPAVLQSVDTHGLVAIAAEADVVIELIPPVGDLIAWDAPLFAIHGEGEDIEDERLRRSIAVGDERTMRQDPAFVFRLLADISSKALSPGVNDPTTSVQSLDQIEMLLRLLAGRRLTPGEQRDGAGTVRFRYPAPTWEDFLSIALDEARFFGETSVQVTRRLRALLEDLHAAAPPDRQPAVEAQIRMLEASVARSFREPADHEIAAARDRQGIGSPGGR